MDTIPTAFVSWSSTMAPDEVQARERILQDWLKERLQKPRMRLLRNEPVTMRTIAK